MGRSHVSHKVILAELHLSEEAFRKVCKGTQAFVKEFRRMNRDEAISDETVQFLSDKWLQQHGKEYFVPRESTYTWPEDAQDLIRIIARLMTSESHHLDKRAGPQTGKRIHQEVSGLLTWANQYPKRPRTNTDSQPDYDEASTPEHSTSPRSRNNIVIPDSPEPIRTSYVVKLGMNQDGNSDWANPNNTVTVQQHHIPQDCRTSPPHQARIQEQPLRAPCYGYQTPMPTPVLTSPFASNTKAPYGDMSLATPLPRSIEDDQRSISEHTEETIEDQSFRVDCNGKEFEVPGQKCANVLQLTLLLLEQLRADLRVASLQRKTLDSQVKVAHILVQIEQELKR